MRATKVPELGHVRIRQLSELRASPENDSLYGPVDSNDPSVRELAESIRQHGFKGVIVISLDGYILSGHRRCVAARLAGLEAVPCVVDPIYRRGPDDPFVTNPAFVAKLEAYNRQRVKSLDDLLHEAVVKANPEEAHRALTKYRTEAARISCDSVIELRQFHRRARISKAKLPFMNAIKAKLADLKDYWPLSDRAIHYQLLNDPPLRHASKPDSYYRNDKESYKSLTELLTRMRLECQIPFECLEDSTRPIIIAKSYEHSGLFMTAEVDQFLKGYYRNLQLSQPNHVEIGYEKDTGRSFVEPVALEFCIPLTVGRGFSSLSPRVAMARRFKRSGKSKLIVISMSDLDPDGDEITHSFARSMRDDFGIDVECIKAALTMNQVNELNLPPNRLKAKSASTNYPKYIERYGSENVYELEALNPGQQKQLLTDAIVSVIDVNRYNEEIRREEKEAAFLDEKRRLALRALGDLGESPSF